MIVLPLGFLLDMDGTVYKGENPIPGAVDFLRYLREQDIPFRFLTNNSSRCRSFYSDRLNRMGFDVAENEIVTSVTATVQFLKDKRPGMKCYVIASPDVKKEIIDAGVKTREKNPDIVLLTFDKTIDYTKINNAYHMILRGAEPIATHPDNLCPTEDSYDVDIGPFIRMLEFLTKKDFTVVGKPGKLMLEMGAVDMGIVPMDAVMVGDRLSTDIKMASDTGARSVLVLSGEARKDDIGPSGIHPTAVVDSVARIPFIMHLLQ